MDRDSVKHAKYRKRQAQLSNLIDIRIAQSAQGVQGLPVIAGSGLPNPGDASTRASQFATKLQYRFIDRTPSAVITNAYKALFTQPSYWALQQVTLNTVHFHFLGGY